MSVRLLQLVSMMRKSKAFRGGRPRVARYYDGQQDLSQWHTGKINAEKLAATTRDGVVAVIVTYHPDQDRLKENLDAVAGQVDAVLVYCNKGPQTPWLTGLLKQYNSMYFISHENQGLAVPLNRACGTARLLNAKYVLLLDQDSVSQIGMVKRLEQAMTDHVGIACPQIIDRNKGESFSYSKKVACLSRAITSGSLVSLEVWENVGGFDERLFVDWVDYEFSCALRNSGFDIVQIGTVYNLHEMGYREHVCTLPRILGSRRLYRINHSKARFEDKARSWMITLHNYMPGKEGIRELGYILAIALRDILLERERVSTIKAFAKGIASARRLVHTDI